MIGHSFFSHVVQPNVRPCDSEKRGHTSLSCRWKIDKTVYSPPNESVQHYRDCAVSIADRHHPGCSDVVWTKSNSWAQTYQRIYLCSRRFYPQWFWNWENKIKAWTRGFVLFPALFPFRLKFVRRYDTETEKTYIWIKKEFQHFWNETETILIFITNRHHFTLISKL